MDPEAKASAAEPADFSADDFSAFVSDTGDVRRRDRAPEPEAPARDDKGRFQPRMAAAGEEPVPEAEPVTPETPEPDAPKADAPAVEPPKEESEGVRTVADLAKAFDLPEDEFLNALHVPTGDGDKTVSLAEALAAFRTPIEERVQKQVSARVAAIDTAAKARDEAAAQATQKLVEVAELLVGEVDARWKGKDWERYRVEDPVAFSADYLEYQRTIQARNMAIQTLRDDQQRTQAEATQKHQEWLQGERAALLNVPEFKHWTDVASATRDLTALGEFLGAQGVSEADVANLVDHRLVRIAWKAMKYDELRAKTALTKDKIRVLPKVLETQSRRPPENKQAKQVDAAMSRLRKSGSVDDATAAAVAAGLLD